MPALEFEPWEPEETVGKIWHAFASRLDAPAAHEAAAVSLSEVERRLEVFFRGLGGPRDVEIKAAPLETSPHRLSWKRRLGEAAERVAAASFDGEALRLPDHVAEFADRETNTALYFWLTAAGAHAREPMWEDDPLRADIRALQAAEQMTRDTLAACPGLRPVHTHLAAMLRDQRRLRSLPPWEAAVEAAILHLLGGPPPDCEYAAAIATTARGPGCDLTSLTAPRGYRPFMPVAIWPDLRRPADRVSVDREPEAADDDASAEAADDGLYRGRRKSDDAAKRKDSLILHKFEAIFSWTEFLNLNRRIVDDDDEDAGKAADDLDEISLTQVEQRTATRLKLHLDLSPEDVDRERLAGKFLYPEWDHRKRSYIPDHCRVLANEAEAAAELPAFLNSPETRRRVRAVRRQFEALRPRRVILKKQVDGDELDVEAAVQAHVDLEATGEHSDRVYRAARCQDRDLGVSILLDVSRSTESAVADRTVIDIEREALIALAWGLSACGDACAIHAFSSLRRDRVFVQCCKTFDEPMSATVEARIAGLRPGFYTRLGAAVRHVSEDLAKRSHQSHLLLIVTDGKPNDLDHYEGRHGVEDSHMAVREARMRGQSVYGVTVDRKGQSQFRRIFGQGGYTVIPDPAKLTAALPELYRHLVAG